MAEETETTPQDAFALIGNEVRADILRTLASPDAEGPWKELSFSELHSRIDPGMDSSQFNYHLQKLVGHYVRSTEDGYQISAAGVKLYRNIVAGTFTREETIEPFDAGFECHFCGTSVQGAYRDNQVQVRCPECEHVYASNIIPPSVVEDGPAILDRVDTQTRHEMLTAANKVCPMCLNELDADIIEEAESPFDHAEGLDVMGRLSCDFCGARRYISIGTILLKETSLVAFAYDHGIDINEIPVWEFEFTTQNHDFEIRSRDPWEVAFSLTLDDETIEFVVDGDLEVVETTVS